MQVVLVLVLVSSVFGKTHNSILQSFTFKPIEKYVKDKGYPIEKHELETEDGYRLTYHRIPHGRQGPGLGHGHPILLAHGILQSSALYLAMDDGLAYLLADAGFDVWLMNARGNTYSKEHTTLNPSSKEFWDFSFHEMGEKDLSIAIVHILSVTQRQTLSYVGFSMGTTMFWVLADSYGKEYMDRIDTMVAIAPIARPSGMSILQKPAIYSALTTALLTYNTLHLYEVRSYNKAEGLFLRALCTNDLTTKACGKMLSGLVGLFPDSIHREDTYVATQYMPAGTSIKNIVHFLQIGEKARFQQFDYGDEENLLHYKKLLPPAYDLRKVTCPVFLITSDVDEFSVKEDVEWLAKELPKTPKMLFHEEVKEFQHLDYFYHENVKQILYKPLVQFLVDRINKT
ncbi:lipase 1-like [Macrosteles quadrilineatus]|uniref:lipase 1-like n=1 Tax=Macrosteles quadrilineatus TaxID=74068 RepID=UPI0023E17E93|nr:lipase 1-like [Macrosteles quadrilineatus]